MQPDFRPALRNERAAGAGGPHHLLRGYETPATVYRPANARVAMSSGMRVRSVSHTKSSMSLS